jgi:hypothetical protein
MPHSVIVIVGGMAALVSECLLRGKRPAVLELFLPQRFLSKEK